ncbi:divalent-cation tolerance protein CutA [Azohydromonas caseinilytica]|uniref:Divalent-cation tolerance protein CutA n=1 Tax=Azohydromonas caseinilytica TaxID=2728836 RepID=A0A848F648_9BURK|nr:divalent-cation tolerance protein CutA [Azohydromonas caseinilytica]NML13833.1 divalent-cation tolerance protein CutA [Azohydromonas caseinilytica]
MKPIAVVTTVANVEDARRLARALVERRLVACAQISQIESVYMWEGALQQEGEYRLVCKTVASRYAAVEEAIRELHPYTLPAIYGVALERVHGPYADWVGEYSGG